MVKAVCKSATHTMSKTVVDAIDLMEGLGVAGDAHMGKTVKHRSRVAKDPRQPNLRQVHLIHTELHAELQQKGFNIKPGEMGENITTEGIDLLNLPKDTILHIGATAKIQLTGLRNPCYQLDKLKKGLMKTVLDNSNQGNLIRKAGVMGIVLTSGTIITGDKIEVELPVKPYQNLEVV